MNFDQIIERLEAAKRHVDQASTTTTFGDMRAQLQLARQACARAIDGMEVQITNSFGAPVAPPPDEDEP